MLGFRSAVTRSGRSIILKRFGSVSPSISLLRSQRSTYSTKIDNEANVSEIINEASETDNLPWYLRENTSSAVSEPVAAPIPEIPAGAPQEVADYLSLLSKNYGLEDIQIFHVNEKDQQLESDEEERNSSYNIICSGKSDKHIYKAANEFRMHIKRESEGDIIPKLEGFVSHSSRNANYRRMIRRARKGPMATDNDYGMGANSWIMCDVGLGVYIHILTVNRRKELDLELLWTEDQNVSKVGGVKNESSLNSDDLFIGIRRQYHTKTAFRRGLHTDTNISVKSAVNEIMQSLESDIDSLVAKFEQLPMNSLEDFHSKFELYKNIHLLYPEIISVDQVISTIWEKYIHFSLEQEINLDMERIQDSINVMKLIMDTPEELPKYKGIEQDERQVSDVQLDFLSKFLRQLYTFSGEKLTVNSITVSPEFLVLLWGFVIIDKTNFIGPQVVDNAMQGLSTSFGGSAIHHSISVYRARGIIDLIELNQIPTTREFDELVLFTLGNSNLSSMFWEYWEKTQILYVNSSPAQGVTNWVRLIVYLSLQGSVKLQTQFLNEKWAPLLGGFLNLFNEVGSFSDEQEKRAFQSAVAKIVGNVRRITQDEAYKGILEFARDV